MSRASAGETGVEPGEVIDGRYRVDGVLGEGGMGTVYRATQLTVGRQVALKVASPERHLDADAQARFEAEARTLASLQHPHVVSLIDFGRRDDGSHWLVMELLPGEPLSDLMAREGPLEVDRVTAIARQLLDALAAAHRHGVIHRDIKPSNVFLARYAGRADYVKLLDFGIAKAYGVTPIAAGITDSVEVVGSPRYVSPEQARSQPVSVRSDLYSLGAVLYEMLTGRPLFDERTPVGWLVAHVSKQPEPPSRDGLRLDGPVVDLVLRCLAKDPLARPASATEALAVLEGSTAPASSAPAEPATRFVGRDEELERLADAIAAGRIVTLVGPGGVGKTRLMLRALHERREPVRLVDLAALDAGGAVASSVAAEVGCKVPHGADAADALAEHFGDRTRLLVLDNCEHVASPAAKLVDTLLARCSGLAVLATSRQPLRARGEVVQTVPTLALPPKVPDGPVPADWLGHVAAAGAVKLFVDRARHVQPDLAVTADNARTIARLVRRLDGLPLALELAAARLRILSLADLLDRLRQRFRLLAEPTLDGQARPRTLRATLDWSYELLGEAEQALLRGLSVFASGWSVQAVQAVCAPGDDGDEWATLDALERLAERSLVHVARDGAGRVRHSLLETVREYAAEKARDAGETAALRAAHGAYFLALAEASTDHLEGPEAGVWLERLAADHDNVRAALSWALDDAPPATAQALVGAMRLFWFTRGHFAEGRAWAERALDRGGSDPTPARAVALDCAGVMAWLQGDAEAAERHLQEALVAHRELGHTAAEARTLKRLGTLAFEAHRWEDAEEWQQAAHAIFTGLGDERGIRETLVNIAITAHDRGDAAGSIVPAFEALALARRAGDRGTAGRALYLLGQSRLELGQRDAAWRHLVEAFDIFRARGERLGVAYLLEAFGTVAEADGELSNAVTLWGAGHAVRQAIRAPLPPFEQAAHDERLRSARERMGAVAYDVCWTRGTGMAVDEAAELLSR